MRPDLSLRVRSLPPFFLILALGALVLAPCRSWAECSGDGPIKMPNVVWGFKDSVSACPAGDSLGFSGHPAKLRITALYYDADCNPKAGVPPESIWVTTSIISGNLIVNDSGGKIFADDSTDATGLARVTLSNFSGCGRVRVFLKVDGDNEGYRDVVVRSVDTDASGRTTTDDWSSFTPCDLNYDGVAGNIPDAALVALHADHWHRHALFGTPRQRSAICDTCPPGTAYGLGRSDVSWSPSGRYLSYTVMDGSQECKVFIVRSDAKAGDPAQQFTFQRSGHPDSSDYDPSWSPLGTEMFFDREDRVIYRKGIAGFNSDTSEVAIYGSAHPTTYVSVSPDGGTVAFTQIDSLGNGHLFTVPRAGGAARQLTSESGVVDVYAKWSPDGRTVVFQRSSQVLQRNVLYTVRADTVPVPAPVPLYGPKTNGRDRYLPQAVLPAFSPDGAVVTAALNDTSNSAVTCVLDGVSAADSVALIAYPRYHYLGLSPNYSPDGTRIMFLAFPTDTAIAVQVFSTQRNMNLPPTIGLVGDQGIADSTARVLVSALQGEQLTLVITATDPEPDQLRYAAYFLGAGMSFDSTKHTFTWTPPAGTSGNTYTVKFVVMTPSGGMDAVLCQISVYSGGAPRASLRDASTPSSKVLALGGPSPARGQLRLILVGNVGETALVDVHDIAGRRLDRFYAKVGSQVVWPIRGVGTVSRPAGIYIVTATIAGQRVVRRFVLLP